jgi:excisionase family DNA binding protein
MVTVTTNGESLTFTVEEAARLLGISRTLAYQSVRDGTIPSVRIGRRYLIPRQALNKLLKSEK